MKRNWLQFHLSTALVMMILAALLLSLNMTAVQFRMDPEGTLCSEYHGWPMWFHYHLFYTNGDLYEMFEIPEWLGATPIIVDALVFGLTVFCAMIVCEWRIRRNAKIQNYR